MFARLTFASLFVTSLTVRPRLLNAATELQTKTESFQDRVMAVGNKLLAQSAEMGALPTLFAATVPDVEGGAYYGPDGRPYHRRNADCDYYYSRYHRYYGDPYCDRYDAATGYCD